MKLEIYWLAGTLKGQSMEFSAYDSPIKIGRRGNDNIVQIRSADVSRHHGYFIYDREMWYYQLGPDEPEPSNGTWKGVSPFDRDNGYLPSDGVRLDDGDNIVIG